MTVAMLELQLEPITLQAVVVLFIELILAGNPGTVARSIIRNLNQNLVILSNMA